MQNNMHSIVFYRSSYAWEIGYRPPCIAKLTDILSTRKGTKLVFEEYPLNALLNALEKLGFMFLARDRIKEIESKRQELGRFHVFVTYHVWSFIVELVKHALMQSQDC